MARYFKLLAMLWLVAASLGASLATTDAPTTTADPTTEPTTDAPTTTADPTTEPTTDAPTTADPTTEPTTDAPTTTADPTTEPTTDAPTTADPTTEPTTDAPTTADPTTEPTTDAPTTTADPTTEPTTDAPTTTADPTTEPTTDAPTTADPTTEPTTDAQTTADPTTEPTTDAPTTADDSTTPGKTTDAPIPNPCAQMPCGSGSTCEPRFNGTFVCICLTGQVYSDERKSCERAKVFPGRLTLTETYDESLKDRTSEQFMNLSQVIVDVLSEVYKDTEGYDTSEVERFEQTQASNTRAWSRNTGHVLAVVEIIFKAAAEITEDIVTSTLEDATESFLSGASFEADGLCDRGACDIDSTKCTSADGSFTCDCLDGYIKTDYSTRLCTACPPGQRATDKGCVKCSFGYSGFNCDEYWQLVLVIVGSVLGGLLLISVIVLIVLVVRSPKKHKDDSSGKGRNYSSKAPLDSNVGAANTQPASKNGTAKASANPGIPTFPRATASSGLDRRNDMEMAPSNRRQNPAPAGRNQRLYEDLDDMSPYSQSKPQSSSYAQVRPQNNPYGQNRPQNPYSSNQGYNNPYYTHDNGRRLY